MMNSGLDFKIQRAPSEIPANLPGQFSLSGQNCLHWAVATHFYVKNVNFKTRDFSPLIERVLAGVKNKITYFHRVQ